MRKGGESIQVDCIVSRIVDGDEEAFRELVHMYRNYLFQVVYSVVRHTKDAEDLVQEVLVSIFFSLPNYKHKGLKAWMTRIAVNKAIDYKRSMNRKQEDMMAEPGERVIGDGGDDEWTESLLLRKEKKELVASKLEQLPSNYQTILVAYYMEHKTYQQIADEQGITVKTVESKLYRARQWARKHWKEEEFE